MSENMYDMDASEAALMESMIRKKNANSGHLMEQARQKAETERNALRKAKAKLGLVSSVLNEDANPPIHEFVGLVKQGPKNGEPSALMWSPTTLENVLALYPQQHAISDINSSVSAANQQPDVPVALVGPGDSRGQYFLKTDKQGNFYMAHGDKNPATYVNPAGSGSHLASVPTTSSFDKSQINTGDVRHVIETLVADIKALRDEVKTLKEMKVEHTNIPTVIDEAVDPLSMDNLLVEKVSIKQQMEGLDDKSKSVIQKLLNAAEAIRNGKAALLDDTFEPAVSPTSTSLTESALSNPIKVPAVSLDSLHEMLLRTTKALNVNRSSLQMERLADNISTLIAEGLMNDSIKSTKLLQETVAAYKELVK